MIGALRIFGLELVGDKPLLVEVGPLLLAAAAAFAAWLAARYARIRQEQQLDHDRDRQREQLDHDRDERYRDHVRDVLDSAMDNVIEAMRANIAFRATLTVKEKSREEHQATIDAGGSIEGRIKAVAAITDINKELGEVSGASHASTMALRAHTWRLRIRLGRGSDVVACHRELTNALVKVHETCVPGVTRARSTAEKEAGDQAVEERKQAFVAFLDACEWWFESSEAQVGHP